MNNIQFIGLNFLGDMCPCISSVPEPHLLPFPVQVKSYVVYHSPARSIILKSNATSVVLLKIKSQFQLHLLLNPLPIPFISVAEE